MYSIVFAFNAQNLNIPYVLHFTNNRSIVKVSNLNCMTTSKIWERSRPYFLGHIMKKETLKWTLKHLERFIETEEEIDRTLTAFYDGMVKKWAYELIHCWSVRHREAWLARHLMIWQLQFYHNLRLSLLSWSHQTEKHCSLYEVL